jgi:signal transduction histidine kinase
MNEFRNLIALPLKIKNQIFGVIKVENKIETVGTCFSSEDETIFEIIANVVSLAIENARLYQQIEGQLKAISAKAAHRINNQAANYDAIELDLEAELQSEICNKENVRTITDRLKLSTRNLKKMIAEFKNYGKPLQLDKQPCSFNKIVQDEIWLARPPEAIIIDRDLDEKIPEVSIDAGRFAEAIKELISNALRAVAKNPGKGGRIHIQTHLASNTNPPVIVLSIEDTGPGFPLGLPLFQPFNSTDPQHIGVGLATVKELVRQHGGEIWAEKTDLGGARIQFTIPINP